MLTEPKILTANTFNWTPDRSASCRRSSEDRKHNEVAAYLNSLGFFSQEGNRTDSRLARAVFIHPNGVTVIFVYDESCKNVYKNLIVKKADGSRSNITLIRKIAKEIQGKEEKECSEE